MTEQQGIDEILTNAAPEPEATPSEPVDNGVQRDERGRFAPKEQSEAITPEPAGEVQPAPPPVAAPSQPQPGFVPVSALVDQRLEARQYRQQVQELERRLREATTPKPEPVDFYADPDAAFNQRIQSALSPYQQQLQETRTALIEERLYRVAGAEKAAKIEEEIGKALEAGDPEVQMLANALQSQGLAAVQSLVQWYDKRSFDPSAERERLKAELLAELQAEGRAPAPAPAAPPAVMPSNLAAARNVGTRAGPAWSGPPAIKDIFKR